MTKIGVMSFAHMHAESYAACINALPEAELSAVWDNDAARGKKAARRFKTKFIGNQTAFLASDIEGVIICSENAKHRAMVEAAAEAGKWILCEKPLAITVDDAKAMIAACRKADVGLGTAFPCRFAGPLVEVKRLIEAGQLGEIYAVSCTNNGSFPGGWFADARLSGGGATMDHTVHVADVLRWLTGREFTNVYGEIGKQVHRKIKTDDTGVLHFEMEGGIKGSHIASWNRCASFPTWGDVTLQIVAERGVLDVDAFNQKLNVYSDSAMKAEWAHWGGSPDMALVRDFVEAVAERREPSVTGVDGLRAVEVTEAAYRSAATGKRVALKLAKI
jgi:predicted dehydrogenase